MLNKVQPVRLPPGGASSWPAVEEDEGDAGGGGALRLVLLRDDSLYDPGLRLVVSSGMDKPNSHHHTETTTLSHWSQNTPQCTPYTAGFISNYFASTNTNKLYIKNNNLYIYIYIYIYMQQQKRDN